MSEEETDSSAEKLDLPEEEKLLRELLDETDEEWYKAKHRRMSDPEVKAINAIPISTCPWCESQFVREAKGYTSAGIRRYVCLDCKKTFTPLTGTLMEGHKIPVSEWLEFLLHLFEFHSTATSAGDNRNAATTGRYWRSCSS